MARTYNKLRRITNALLPHISREELSIAQSSKNIIKHDEKKKNDGNEMCGPSDAVFKQRTSEPRTGTKNAWPALMVP
jgi:hypothetical protein